MQAELPERVGSMLWVVCGRNRSAIQRVLFFVRCLLNATDAEASSVARSLSGTQVGENTLELLSLCCRRVGYGSRVTEPSVSAGSDRVDFSCSGECPVDGRAETSGSFSLHMVLVRCRYVPARAAGAKHELGWLVL
eukprot:IDg6113t1